MGGAGEDDTVDGCMKADTLIPVVELTAASRLQEGEDSTTDRTQVVESVLDGRWNKDRQEDCREQNLAVLGWVVAGMR